MGGAPHAMYLELRRRPMSREHARPQPPAGSRWYGRGAEEQRSGAGRGHRPPNPAAQGPSWAPRTTPSPTQLLTGPMGRTGANNSPPGPSDRAAGQYSVPPVIILLFIADLVFAAFERSVTPPPSRCPPLRTPLFGEMGPVPCRHSAAWRKRKRKRKGPCCAVCGAGGCMGEVALHIIFAPGATKHFAGGNFVCTAHRADISRPHTVTARLPKAR
jgi:hypothetical protein